MPSIIPKLGTCSIEPELVATVPVADVLVPAPVAVAVVVIFKLPVAVSRTGSLVVPVMDESVIVAVSPVSTVSLVVLTVVVWTGVR